MNGITEQLSYFVEDATQAANGAAFLSSVLEGMAARGERADEFQLKGIAALVAGLSEIITVSERQHCDCLTDDGKTAHLKMAA